MDRFAAIAVIQNVPSKAHYRTRAAAGGLRRHSLNVCIHWQQQALSSHDESSALGFAPLAIRFTASCIAFGRQRGSSIALLLVSACLQALSADLPPCDKAVRFSAAWFADPEVDNAKPAAELTKIGAGAGRSGTQLGHVAVETKLAVMPQTSCHGVVVRQDYIKPVLRVASEIPPGSCAYAHVMRHEQTHVRIHRDIARQFRELDYPWASGGSSAGILVYAKQELDRLMQAHVLFDNPEEYARSFSACGGEIAQLVKPAASTKSGLTPG